MMHFLSEIEQMDEAEDSFFNEYAVVNFPLKSFDWLDTPVMLHILVVLHWITNIWEILYYVLPILHCIIDPLSFVHPRLTLL